MMGSTASTGADLRPGTSAPGVPRGAALAAFLIAMAFAAFARGIVVEDGAPSSLLAEIFLGHKIAWLCLAIAATHLLRAENGMLTNWQLLAMVPAALSSAVAFGSWPWLGFALSLALLTRSAKRATRTGLTIATALALHQALMPLVAQLAGDSVLALDARIAHTIAGLLVPSISLDGTTMTAGGGHSVTLVWGCSALSQIGSAVLLSWSLCSLAPEDAQSGGRKLLLTLSAVAIGVILLNTIRLAVLATSPSLFSFTHDGAGATLFRLAALALSIAAACSYHWSCRCVR